MEDFITSKFRFEPNHHHLYFPQSLNTVVLARGRFSEGGQEWIRTTEVEDSGFTVRSIWPLWNLPGINNSNAKLLFIK